MPKKALKPCKHPGCPKLTEGAYCDKHKHLHPDRPSAAMRVSDEEMAAAEQGVPAEAPAMREVYGTGTVHSSNCGRPYHSASW